MFSDSERSLLSKHFTNVDRNVFALTNLPEVVKGALYARYSRSPKSLRELFLDEFATDLSGTAGEVSTVGVEHAEGLYQRVFTQFGDDSVAQLGGAHVAFEEISNLLTKQVEWGRLASYLEQSTRYIPYTEKVVGADGTARWRYYRDPDVLAGPHGPEYELQLDAIFQLYADAYAPTLQWVRETYPRDEDTSEFVWKAATKAKALDLLRGMLPAATTANVGMFASGQAYEALLLRLRGSALAEAREVGGLALEELRKVIPSFLTRVDRPDRGGVWTKYLAENRSAVRALANGLAGGSTPATTDEVVLVDWSPSDATQAEGELVAAAMYPHLQLPLEQVRDVVGRMSADERAEVLRAYVGDRTNRRHKPGRAFESVGYTFDVLGDYGAFRDLQRHRMCTIEWQDLTTEHGYEMPEEELAAAGAAQAYTEAMDRSDALYTRLVEDHPVQAQYAVCFAYRMRYAITINARAAMHLVELRSTPQGHPSYRRVAQRMHELISEVHPAVGAAMSFVDHGSAELERLDAEKRSEARRNGN